MDQKQKLATTLSISMNSGAHHIITGSITTPINEG